MQTIVNVMVDKQLYKYVGHIQEIAYIFIKVINYIVLQSTMNDLNFFGLKKSLLIALSKTSKIVTEEKCFFEISGQNFREIV